MEKGERRVRESVRVESEGGGAANRVQMRAENQLQQLQSPGARKAGRRSPNRGEITGTRI